MFDQIWEFLGVDGWLRQGISLNIPNHDVQIVRFDENNSSFVVKVDNRVDEVDSDKVIDYIVNRI
jgi:hypothetical protein